MRKFLRISNIEFFLILGFFISAFSFSIIISSSYRSYRVVVEKNNFNKDYNMLSLKTKGKEITGANVVDLLESKGVDNITTAQLITNFQVGDDFIVNRIIGVTKGFNIEKYDIIEGRNFTQEEKCSNKKIAIIGNNLKKYVVKVDDKSYIKVFDENYEVVGIMRDSEFLKEVSIVPIKSLYFIDNKYKQFNLLVGVNQLDKLNTSNFSEFEFSANNIPHVSVIKYLFRNVSILKDNVYGVLLGIINLILFSYFFAQNIKPKIAIMKVLGAKNIDVYKEVFGKITKISVLGIILGLIFSKLTIILINTTFARNYGYQSLNIYNILITSLLIFLISNIVSLIILFNVIKFKLLKEIR